MCCTSLHYLPCDRMKPYPGSIDQYGVNRVECSTKENQQGHTCQAGARIDLGREGASKYQIPPDATTCNSSTQTMPPYRFLLSLFLTSHVLVNAADSSPVDDYDVLQYVNPLIGSANGGKFGQPPETSCDQYLILIRKCVPRCLIAIWHGQSCC